MSRRVSISVRELFIYLVAALVLVACAAPAAGDATAVPTSPVPVPIEDLLVYVPAGHFFMGSDATLDPLAEEDEFPIHPVLLDGFFIYRNEVSNSLYQQCVAAGECTPPSIFEDGPSTHYNDPEYKENPVVGVNWDQAAAFCGWAEARLPTEAEWEKAARGQTGDLYPWGADDPSCSLSNMAGCFVDPPDTNMIGQYPEGESYYLANDMSGNVWEWTLDFYDPEYYQISDDENPGGPEQGDLRTVRGGSYEDGPDALRAAERFGLDPDVAYNNVGFRCVPMGEERAVAPPFCAPSYVPFCRDPYKDPNEDCDPTQIGELTPTPVTTGYDFVAFGCPDRNGQVPVTIDSDSDLSGQIVTVGGVQYTCVESTQTPGRWVCTGPHPEEGTLTTVEVCPGDSAGGTGLVAYQPAQPSQPSLAGYQAAPEGQTQLVAYSPQQQARPELVAYQPANDAPAGLQGYAPSAGQQGLVAFQSAANTCPNGYLYNPTTGQCEQDPNGSCPDGWNYNTASDQCEPGDNGCPEGTTLAATGQGCTPDTGQDCPDGYNFAAASNTCEPPGNEDGGACPAGYYFNAAINCCAPRPGDNLGCDPGSYRSVATNECVPYDENGCQDGYVYNRYEGGCVPDYGDGDNQTTDEDGCRVDGYVMNDAGQCVPGDNSIYRTVGGCPEGAYYDANLQQCIQTGDDGCGPGYFRSAASNTCVPGDGPGSGCPNGYAYSTRLNCCTPTPGSDGSYCPGDQTGDGQTPSLAAYNPPSATGYDYGYGYCDPQDGEPCPDGYMYDTGQQTCIPTTIQRTVDSGYCPEGTYYDQEMMYCVPTSCGCELGYYYDRQMQTCLPYGGDQPTGEQGCWEYTVSVPECPDATSTPTGCEADEKYNPLTGKCERACNRGEVYNTNTGACEEPESGGGQPVACSSYGNQNACVANGCTWNFTSATCN
ncbi:MAG: formylglycine-generating enzyme family protein [Anaerolineales bacterium]